VTNKLLPVLLLDRVVVDGRQQISRVISKSMKHGQ
jgi:hypothetical protein